MSAMDKVNGFLAKLPFVKLAGNIPAGIRGKIPVMDLLLPFANHRAVLLAAVVLVACFGGGGGAASPNDFSYELFDSDGSDGRKYGISAGIEITGYSGNGGKVVIPATIEGYPVVAIGYHAFMGSQGTDNGPQYYPAYGITEVVIPDTVGIIYAEAFVGCRKLKTINLPVSLKHMSGRVFNFCPELVNVTIPASLTKIDAFFDNFAHCEKLPLKTRTRLKELGLLAN
jgi:hypothetical protein